ncbi:MULTISPECIES: hypothetical protein [unclassified Streptomyces]|uniref:hypothetical protein n=1 Tax=unclassified Streptomyces TaxID=2593676 RepID=UPI0040438958
MPCVHIPEQSVLPPGLIEELGLTGRLAGGGRRAAGGEANRVKSVRLRGELSQGIVCRPRAPADVDLARTAAETVVPRLYAGPYGIERVPEFTSGRATVSGRGLHLRERVVIRAAVERYTAVTGGRVIAEAVGPAYLTRKDGTECE